MSGAADENVVVVPEAGALAEQRVRARLEARPWVQHWRLQEGWECGTIGGLLCAGVTLAAHALGAADRARTGVGLVVAGAFAAPSDPWSRARGRQIALGRLARQMANLMVPGPRTALTAFPAWQVMTAEEWERHVADFLDEDPLPREGGEGLAAKELMLGALEIVRDRIEGWPDEDGDAAGLPRWLLRFGWDWTF